MKILITGSSGMLGTDLVEVLSPHFQVYGLSRHSTKATGFTPIQLDLTDCEKLREKILDIKPDLVIHAAAFTRVDDCESQKELAEKQNTEVVRKIIDICNEVNAFLIFFSTDYVFSGQKQEPYLENDPVEPQSVYGRTKAWAEAALK